ncbi:MAG: hypothetical protein V4722_24135 [Bacteroidota bacterium]
MLSNLAAAESNILEAVSVAALAAESAAAAIFNESAVATAFSESSVEVVVVVSVQETIAAAIKATKNNFFILIFFVCDEFDVYTRWLRKVTAGFKKYFFSA